MQLIANNIVEVLAMAASSALVGWIANTISTMYAVKKIKRGSKLSRIAHGINQLVAVIDKEDDK